MPLSHIFYLIRHLLSGLDDTERPHQETYLVSIHMRLDADRLLLAYRFSVGITGTGKIVLAQANNHGRIARRFRATAKVLQCMTTTHARSIMMRITFLMKVH